MTNVAGPETQNKTIYDMKFIILRCLEESQKAEHIDIWPTINGGEVYAIKNKDAVADHISKTLIGELMEFETLRRLGPALRSMKSVENDLEYLFNREQTERGLQNLKIPTIEK